MPWASSTNMSSPRCRWPAGCTFGWRGTPTISATSARNQKLSERRAQAIADYLVSRGVDARRIVARGNGASKPVASNKTPEGRARNRRTEILFIPGRA